MCIYYLKYIYIIVDVVVYMYYLFFYYYYYSYSSSSSSSSLLVRTICRASGLDYILLLSVLSVWVRAASTHSLLMEPRPSISHFTMSP